MSRLSLPRLGASLPNVRLTRKPAAPAPTDALARQLQAATERAATAPEGPEATGISSGFSVLDPTRKEVAVTKLWETWEEEEYRFLQTNAAEQAQLVGKSGFADGRSSWARKIPALQVPAVQRDFSPDLRLIPPKAKGVRFVAGTEESENQAEEEWKFLEDQSAENAEVEEEATNVAAQSGKEAQELLSGGSDGPTELQESQEDAANLKQVAMLLQRVEQLEAELHARPSSDAKEPPSDGQETFSVEAVAAAAAAAVLQSLQPIAEVKEAQHERGTGSGSQEEEVASAWVPDEAESRLPALCSGGPGIRGADVLAAKADALKGTADEGPQERLERFRRFKYISSNETVPPGARAAGTERRRPSASNTEASEAK